MQNNKDIRPRNNKKIPHGCWEVYWHNNNLWYKCFYVNGVIYGYSNSYSPEGTLIYKTYYAR